MFEFLEVVICDVWEKEVTPPPHPHWRDAVLVSIYKQGTKSECGNFRGIFLVHCRENVLLNYFELTD